MWPPDGFLDSIQKLEDPGDWELWKEAHAEGLGFCRNENTKGQFYGDSVLFIFSLNCTLLLLIS